MVIAATGDDKANVVLSLLAKTEFAVPRVVARVNDPRNEWLFDEAWGVDVAVSTPRMLAALVEEAVSVGDLVRLMSFRQGQANLVEVTLPDDTAVGRQGRANARTAAGRGPGDDPARRRVIVPQDDEPLEAGDELLFVASPRSRTSCASSSCVRLIRSSGQSACVTAGGGVARSWHRADASAEMRR